MDRSFLCFLPGSGLPLSRPSIGRRSSSALSLRPPKRYLLRASGSDVSQDVGHRVSVEVGSGPDVSFGSVSPPLRKIVSAIVVAASAGVAFKAVPVQGPMRPVAALSTAAIVSAVGAATVRNGPYKAARKYLAEALCAFGVGSAELADRSKRLSTKFGIADDEALEMKQSLYQLFILALVDNASVAFSEMSDLARLKQTLGLSGSVVGDAHYEACREFYRNNVIFIDAADDEVSRDIAQKKLDKLVFLSDRMYADKDTEEAYRYEKSRIKKFFAMDETEYQDRVARVALPFYKEVIVRASKDSSVGDDDILAAQATLGVRDIDAERIRTDVYADRVETLIAQKGKLDSSDNESLSRLRAVLGIEDSRAMSTIKALAEPIFREDVIKALNSIEKDDESMPTICERLALRQNELSLPTESAQATMAKEMSARGVEIVRLASKYLRVQNVNSCIRQVSKLLEYVNSVVEFIKTSHFDAKEDDAIVRQFLPDVASSLSAVELRQMYRIFLSSCLEDRRISPEEEVRLARLRALFNISNQNAIEAFSLATGPVYRKAVMEAIETNSFSEEGKEKIRQLRADLSLPESTWKVIELDIYSERLRKLVGGNRILQEQEAQELFVFREFLGLTTEDTAPVHKTYMGPVYEQSVTEAMGPTGIMLEEYRKGLERLRERLGLSKGDADQAFYKVVKQRMLLYVNRALSQLEKRQAFRGQNEERDVGDDPNIRRAGAFLGIDAGGLPIELSNLVDFYVRNGLVKTEEVEVEGEKKKVQKYPITLRQDISPKVYNELYKQYVVQCFSAQTRSEKQRLFSVLDQLGCILGLNEDEVGKIHSEIGTVIYKNYVNQALLRGPLEDKDKEFLTNIQNMLSMKEEQCGKLLRDAKESRISAMLEQIFAQPKVLPETVKRMRDMAAALEVDIVKDLKIPPEQRGKMFNVEIDAAIDTGALTAENQALIGELQTSLQVSDESAREILLSCIQRRTLSHLVQATASLRQGRSGSAVSELKAMLRFGKLLPAKVKAPAVSIEEKQELYLLFQADVITDGAVDQSAREQINLLKTLFGFSDADLEVLV